MPGKTFSLPSRRRFRRSVKAKAGGASANKPPAAPSPLQYLKGVGPSRAALLSRLGIESVKDLVTTYPREWQDRRLRFSIREAPMGEKTTLTGKILAVKYSSLRRNLGL